MARIKTEQSPISKFRFSLEIESGRIALRDGCFLREDFVNSDTSKTTYECFCPMLWQSFSANSTLLRTLF